jgi:hypothetical protein
LSVKWYYFGCFAVLSEKVPEKSMTSGAGRDESLSWIRNNFLQQAVPALVVVFLTAATGICKKLSVPDMVLQRPCCFSVFSEKRPFPRRKRA